uniref:Uncharacterized protein n=1 Tax=Anguilla anguilla TaxID=7936 RepID=A0A0E9X892_ANGAN
MQMPPCWLKSGFSVEPLLMKVTLTVKWVVSSDWALDYHFVSRSSAVCTYTISIIF